MSQLAAVQKKPYTPRQEGEPAVWLRASDIQLPDGSTVTGWTDLSVNGRTPVQVAAAPTLERNRLNGHAVVNFEAALQQYLKVTFGAELPQPNTVYIVCRASGSSQRFMDGIVTGKRHLVNINVNGFWQINAGANLIASASRQSVVQQATAVFDGASSLIRVDGVQVAAGNAGANALSGLVLGDSFDLRADLPLQWLNGIIAELIIFHGHHSLAAMQRVERCQKILFGLPTGAATFPLTKMPFQLGRTTGLANIAIRGAYPTSAGVPAGVEARFRGGAWTDIGATFAAGSFSGTLANQAPGNGLLEVRFTGTGTVFGRIENILAGHIVFPIGQSNNAGHGVNLQTWSHATLLAVMWRESSAQWNTLADPTDSDAAFGSVWPHIAQMSLDEDEVPFAIVTAAEDGTGLVSPPDWAYGGAKYDNAITVLRASGITGLLLVDLHQGEEDANNGVSTAAYKAGAKQLIRNINIDTEFEDNLELIASDAFGGADGASLNGHVPELGSAWVVRNGTIQFSGGRIVPIAPAPANPGYIATTDLGEADAILTTVVNLGDGGSPQYIGVVARYNAADGSHYMVGISESANKIGIYEWTGAAYTLRAESSTTINQNTDYTLTVRVAGSRITADAGASSVTYTSVTTNPTSTLFGVRIALIVTGSIASFTAQGLRLPMMVTQIGYKTTSGQTRANLDNIRIAQSQAADEDPVLIKMGPPIYDIGPLADGVHATTDAELLEVARRKRRMHKYHFHGGTEGRAPRIASITRTDATHYQAVFTLQGTTSLVLGASPHGWRCTDATGATLRAVVGVTLVNATTISVEVDSAVVGDLVSFASFNDAVGTTLRDNGETPLPPEPFIAQVVG